MIDWNKGKAVEFLLESLGILSLSGGACVSDAYLVIDTKSLINYKFTYQL